MKKKLLIVLFIALGMGFTSCSASKNIGNAEYNNNDYTKGGDETEFKITYRFESDDLKNLKTNIKTYVRDAEGYVVESEEGKLGEGNFVYKIPTSKLDDTLDKIDELDGRTFKKVSSKDDSSSLANYKVKIESLEKTKAEYEEMLKDTSLTVAQKEKLEFKINDVETQLKYYTNKQNEVDKATSFTKIYINYNAIENKSWGQKYWGYLGNFAICAGTIFMYALPFIVIGGGIATIIIVNQKKKDKKRLISNQMSNNIK